VGFKHDYIIFGSYNITKIELRGTGILYTVLLILEMILLEAFGFEGADDLGNEGCSGSRRIFRSVR
jgi:hypothetical protein